MFVLSFQLFLISAICESLLSIIRCLSIRSCLLLVIVCWCALFKLRLLLQLICLLKFVTINDNILVLHSNTVMKATDHYQLKK